MPIQNRSFKASSPNVKIQDVPNVPTIGSATETVSANTVDVSFTPANTGGRAAVYRAVSTPAGGEGISYGSSPITVSGLTKGTAYTFSVRGETSTGATTGYSATGAGITPVFGAMELISTAYGNGSSSNISFTNIPQGYKHLQVRMTVRSTNNLTYGDYGTLGFNGTGGVSHFMYGSGSSVASGYQNWSSLIERIPNTYDPSGTFAPMILDIVDYNNTSKYKTTRLFSGWNGTSYRAVFLYSGLWQNTNALTQLDIGTAGIAWATGSRFSLYGIKG